MSKTKPQLTQITTRLRLAVIAIVLTLSSCLDLNAAAIPTTESTRVNEVTTCLRGPQPDLSGTWSGKLYQNEGGIAPEFKLTMEIIHHGIFVRGTSYVIHDGIWAEMRFSGYQKENGAIVLTETEILRSKKPDDLSWCMKEYELRADYTAEGLVLSGPWWGDSIYGACIPGSVLLKRKVKTA